MAERYSGFPNACPAGHAPDGTMRYYNSTGMWAPPALDRPLHSRDYKYHGMRLKGATWGWEQACFHNYYLEHLNGELPARCPPIVLDRTGMCMVHLAGMKQSALSWDRAAQPRVTFKDQKHHRMETPCVLHANGPAKKSLRSIWHWWEDPQGRTPSWS